MCFTPCAGTLTGRHITAHLDGQEIFAAYLHRMDGRVKTVVIDLDAPISGARRGQAAEPVSEEQRGVIRELALCLWRTAKSFGIPASLEDSGQKGFHLWILFTEAVEADAARHLARRLAVHAGLPEAAAAGTVRVEVLPRHSEWTGPELGDAVKLPLGIHPATGRRCPFLDEDGEPISDPEAALAGLQTLAPEATATALRHLSRPPSVSSPAPPGRGSGKAAALVSQCAVVRTLVERAQARGHLRHTHDLILLYTAGRLGEEGAAFIHRTLSHCHNYVPDICQRYIDQLDPDRRPITCRRIREWLEEDGESGLCTCPGTRHTPLDGIVSPGNRSSRQEQSVAAQRLPTIEWAGVAEELFPILDTPTLDAPGELPATHAQEGVTDTEGEA